MAQDWNMLLQAACKPTYMGIIRWSSSACFFYPCANMNIYFLLHFQPASLQKVGATSQHFWGAGLHKPRVTNNTLLQRYMFMCIFAELLSHSLEGTVTTSSDLINQQRLMVWLEIFSQKCESFIRIRSDCTSIFKSLASVSQINYLFCEDVCTVIAQSVLIYLLSTFGHLLVLVAIFTMVSL